MLKLDRDGMNIDGWVKDTLQEEVESPAIVMRAL